MSAERKRHKETERKRPPKARTKPHAIAPAEAAVALSTGLLDDLRSLIEKARTGVAAAVNVETVMLNWHLGQRIWREILSEERAEYGKQIVDALSRQLSWTHLRTLMYVEDRLHRAIQVARERLAAEEPKALPNPALSPKGTIEKDGE